MGAEVDRVSVIRHQPRRRVELQYGMCGCMYPCSCVEFDGKRYSSTVGVVAALDAQLAGAVEALREVRHALRHNSHPEIAVEAATAIVDAALDHTGAVVSVTAHCETCGQPVREWNGSRNDLIGLSSMWAKRAHAAEGEVEALRQQLAGGSSGS